MNRGSRCVQHPESSPCHAPALTQAPPAPQARFPSISINNSENLLDTMDSVEIDGSAYCEALQEESEDGDLGRRGTGGIDGARRRFVLADCMGHGMPARLQAAMLGGLLSGQARDRWGGPDTCLDALSAAIITSPAVGQLIATVLAVDLAGDGSLELASGGHPSPVLLGEGKARVLPLDGAMPGLTATCGAQPRRVRLKPGERLFMATDGLAPASNITLEGMPEGICQALRKSPDLPLDAAANAIEAAAVEALGTNPDDDWTFVLIERAP